VPSAPKPLRVLWISDFPIEWLAEVPEELRSLPRQHPLTWMRVLQGQMAGDPEFDLHIAVLRKGIPRDLSFSLPGGATVHVLKILGGIRAPTLFCADTIRLRSLAKRLKPDVVHAWGSERGAMLVAHRLGYPYVATVQGLMRWYAELIPVNRHERFAMLLEKWSLPKAPLATTESLAAVEYLHRHYPKLSVLQAEHAPAPLFFDIVRQPQLAPPRLLCVGFLNYRKGADLLLAALERLGSRYAFEFVIAGYLDSAFEPEWKRLSEGPLAGRLTLRQGVPPEGVAAELSRATMLVFPTRADTSPNAVKEAAVAGVPVVGTRIGGIPDYITDGANGLLVTPDADALTSGLERALQDPRFSRGEVSPEAKAKAREWLSPALMKEKFCGAYRRLAGR
jgi:glycosyltransferase involved in cell wall biosynthesis